MVCSKSNSSYHMCVGGDHRTDSAARGFHVISFSNRKLSSNQTKLISTNKGGALPEASSSPAAKEQGQRTTSPVPPPPPGAAPRPQVQGRARMGSALLRYSQHPPGWSCSHQEKDTKPSPHCLPFCKASSSTGPKDLAGVPEPSLRLSTCWLGPER